MVRPTRAPGAFGCADPVRCDRSVSASFQSKSAASQRQSPIPFGPILLIYTSRYLTRTLFFKLFKLVIFVQSTQSRQI